MLNDQNVAVPGLTSNSANSEILVRISVAMVAFPDVDDGKRAREAHSRVWGIIIHSNLERIASTRRSMLDPMLESEVVGCLD
jgi:hypothetical protein